MVLIILIYNILAMEQLPQLENSLNEINLYLDINDDVLNEQEFADIREQLFDLKKKLIYLRGRVSRNVALSEVMLLFNQTMNRINHDVNIDNNIIEHGLGVTIGGEHHFFH